MTGGQDSMDERVPTQLVLPVPAAALPLLLADGAALLRQLDPACLVAEAEGGRLDRDLAAAAHAAGIPVLLVLADEAPHRIGADGVYLTDPELPPEEVAGWRDSLAPDAMILAWCGASRHAAMEAAEAGADAVVFGGSAEDVKALVEWWAPLMEVPCIAAGPREPGQALALAAAGADFVLPDPVLWAEGGGAALTAIAEALAGAPVAEG